VRKREKDAFDDKDTFNDNKGGGGGGGARGGGAHDFIDGGGEAGVVRGGCGDGAAEAKADRRRRERVVLAPTAARA
jgi:hypothetical protein